MLQPDKAPVMARTPRLSRPVGQFEASGGWLAPALILTLVVLALRLWGLWLNQTDLFVDEAQYWLWAQEPALGYYSKPPMIAWVIGLFGAFCGDSTFCVRLPAPILHSFTALILGAIAAGLYGRRAAILVVAAFLTLPMVSLSSLLMSTDTVMFPFLALALWAYLACLGGASAWVAFAGGLALGLAFLSKYAALYYVLCAVLAAGLKPRLGWRHAVGFLIGFALAAAPNVVWNLFNGLTTVQHTLDNVDWVRGGERAARLNPAGLAEFFAAQFGVFGPVLFGGLLWLALGWRGRDPGQKRWLLFALPIIAIVCAQALISRAYANWAAAAYLAGTIAVVPWLAQVSRPWLRVSFAINILLAVLLPLITIFPDLIAPGGRPAAERYLGRAALSSQAISLAKERGLGMIVSGNRDVLADLFYTGREAGLEFRARPVAGRVPHHYALRYPFTGHSGPVLLIDQGAAPCAGAHELAQTRPESGAWRGKSFTFWQVDAACILGR